MTSASFCNVDAPPVSNFIRNTSLFVLIGRAAASIARHAWLYSAVALASTGAQALVYAFWHSPITLLGAGIVATSLAGSVLYAFTLSDVDEMPAAQAWLRALERAWATIVVNFGQTFVMAVGQATLLAGNIIDRLSSIALLLIGISLNFSDVDAVVSEDDNMLLLVPQALVHSIRTTWSGTTMLRAIALVLTQIFVELAGSALESPLQALHVPNAEFWAIVPLESLTFVPLAVITVYVYLDAIGYESKRSCGE